MATLQCAISGIRFNCDYLAATYIPSEAGYFHPVFALDDKSLNNLYQAHCKGKLETTDSYLLFLAILHSSGKIKWKHHATLNPTSPAAIKLVESNLSKLIAVLAKTESIALPSFSQPSYVVRQENSDLSQVKGWIEAWDANIDDFYSERATWEELQALQNLENRLSYQILSGNDPKHYAGVIAAWASRAAQFPPELDASYQEVIRTCFNKAKMFSTPISFIKEVADFCSCNIEAGSIHFHTLTNALQEGVKNHIDYLGVASSVTEYTILPNIDTIDTHSHIKNAAEVAAIASKAPKSEPVRANYLTQIDFIRAKLAYRVATNAASVKENEGNL